MLSNYQQNPTLAPSPQTGREATQFYPAGCILDDRPSLLQKELGGNYNFDQRRSYKYY
jgi:hypothetical protein